MQPSLPLLLSVLCVLPSLSTASGENFNCSGTVCDPVITPCCDDPDTGCPGDKCSKSQLRVVSPFSQCGCCHSCIDYLVS